VHDLDAARQFGVVAADPRPAGLGAIVEHPSVVIDLPE
jgi:hypothetical protein